MSPASGSQAKGQKALDSTLVSTDGEAEDDKQVEAREKENRDEDLHEKCLMDKKRKDLVRHMETVGVVEKYLSMVRTWNFHVEKELADLVLRYNCSKEECERVVVDCSGDLESALERLRALKHQQSAPPEIVNPLALSGGDEPQEPIPSATKETDENSTITEPISSAITRETGRKASRSWGRPLGSGDKKVQPLAEIDPKADWPLPQTADEVKRSKARFRRGSTSPANSNVPATSGPGDANGSMHNITSPRSDPLVSSSLAPPPATNNAVGSVNATSGDEALEAASGGSINPGRGDGTSALEDLCSSPNSDPFVPPNARQQDFGPIGSGRGHATTASSSAADLWAWKPIFDKR